jgi:transposase-like protein/ribosomal protein S27AE
MNHREIVIKTIDYKSSIIWMMERGYLDQNKVCSQCLSGMVLSFANSVYKWRCNKCKTTKSVFETTIFHNSNKKVNELIDLIYFWSKDDMQIKTRKEIRTKSQKTSYIWYNKLRKLSYTIMTSLRPQKIGGIGHIVEIDESLFSKRKYNVGRSVRQIWVLGGIDITTGDSFFVEVLRRDAQTLENVIRENVEIGSTIFTDGWRGYTNLANLGYTHYTVNHKENFIDSISLANTQAIENSWSVFKRKMRARYINGGCNITLVFVEFLFKKKFKTNVFEKIMENLKDSLNKIDF